MAKLSFISVSLDYMKAIQQASRLSNAAERCAEMNRKMKAQMTELSSGWQGDAAVAMAEKLESWYAENVALERELRNVASQMRTAAEKIKQADENAAKFIGRF